MAWLVSVLLTLFLVFECQAEEQSLEQVVKANEKFTANVYKQLITSEKGNVIFSGLSAEIILSLLTDGAKGDTQTQLLTGLGGLPQSQQSRDEAFQQLTTRLNINTEKLKLLSANKIYPAEQFEILDSFNKTAVNVYQSDVQNLNYQNQQEAANTINQWVEDHTNNKIQNLIDPSQLSPATVLVLVNALYFSGDWVRPFRGIGKREFYTSETEFKLVDTMSLQTSAKYKQCNYLRAKFLELGFKKGNISMVFILPNSRNGLQVVENNIEKYLATTDLEIATVGITLPKFTINTKINFVPILQKLGITKVFTDQADLSGISSQHDLKVDFVVQKAFINVTETGVEAAAATGVGVTSLSLPPTPKYYFKANHPFVFYIKDNKTGSKLFVGIFRG